MTETATGPALRQAVCRELELAGFTIHDGGPAGGVEVRECPPDHGGGVLVSWAPAAAAFQPIDERVTAVEKTMAGALLRVLEHLGFTAEPLGESFSVRVAAA
ncbi:hypothetical protein VSH64_07700 [Amycolatopsis rhabdoformis]|uniref:Uncharacterized protein n=1 Tax=Amycolatopsis rhabdoformis TaxID=1448059 RepID=A0ABZ1IE15_9PSEU|nr:hypothetical protein [Amycolatopsis rhabdoformis]WSE31991.1 hypothetical protein VSH64_07700 [Amycolatopsis rhabdoformis]